MTDTASAAGESPIRHLMARAMGMLQPKAAKGKAEDDGIDPEDEGEIEQSEVDDALDDADVKDVEDGAKKGKAKGKAAKSKAEDADDEDDGAKAEMDDDKDAKAYRRGLAAGATRENARCRQIFATKAGMSRPDLAAIVAFGTRQTSEEATRSLELMSATGQAGLTDRMASRVEARPGADGGPAAGAGNLSLADRMAAAKKKAGIA